MNKLLPLAPGKGTICGVPEGHDARILADHVARANGPVIHVVRDDVRARATRRALAATAPDLPVMSFPAWDCLAYDRVSPNAEISAARMAFLATMAAGYQVPSVILTTVSAATQRVPAREVVRASSYVAEVGKRINEAELRAYLVRMGYVHTPTVMEPGDFAIRGGLIDIFPPGTAEPVRLDLFGDVLDGARRFDPATQRTAEKLSVVELAPVSEVILDEAAITRFRQNYRIEFGAAGTDDPLYEAVSAGRKHQGFEHWLPFFHDRLETLFDYVAEATICLDDQVTPARLSRWESIEDQYDTRRHALDQKNRMDSVYKPAPPGLLYLDDAAWEAIRPLMNAKTDAQFVTLRDDWRTGIPAAGPVDEAAANAMLSVMAGLGGEKLVGKANSLPDGTFLWFD